jgi:pyruvate dehydrogenase E1 component beta subunit
VVVVDEGWKTAGISAEIAACIAEQAVWELDAPIRRVCSEEVPVPYARHLEVAALPQPDEIVAAARELVGR